MEVVVAALSAQVQLNGVSRHAINLARALLSVRTIARVHVLAGVWQKQIYDGAFNDLDARLHIHWMPLADANLSRLSWYYRELPYIAAQLEADVVHLTYPVPVPAKTFHCPTVLSLHDLYPFELPGNFGFWKSAIARLIMTRCIQRVDAIACVSASTQAHLGRWFPTQIWKSIVVPNGVDLKPSPVSECSVGSLKDTSFILCVAQHRCNKNLPLAIRVFEQLLQKRILPADSRLVVVGIQGPDTRKMHEQIRQLRLYGKVLLLSGLSDADLRWCYEHCAVLLVPSNIEGFGLPVAEGILAGCRIVCSDIPAFREIGGENCRFVSFGGNVVDAYVDAIRDALTFPKPRNAYLPQFCLGNIGRKYSDLYETLVCSRIPEFDMLRQPEVAPVKPNQASSRSA